MQFWTFTCAEAVTDFWSGWTVLRCLSAALEGDNFTYMIPGPIFSVACHSVKDVCIYNLS